MLFSFKAAKKDGTHYEGTLEAADKFALYKELHDRGDVVLKVSAKGAKSSFKEMLNISFGGAKVVDRIMFAKNLGAMLRAGLPLARALSVLERQMTSKTWKPIFATLNDNLAKGVPLSTSLGTYPKTFSPLFVSMVAAGEESGSLAQSLFMVGEQLEKSHQLSKKVKGAMMYPAIIFIVMIIIAVLMFIIVVPKLTATFKEFNAQLPFVTRMVMAVSDFFANHYLLVLGLFILVAGGFYAISKTKRGRSAIDLAVLKLPIIGNIAKEVNSARTARTLSSLLSSGVEVVASIKIAANVVQNVHYKEMLARTAEDIQKGATLQSLFLPRGDIYPSFVAEMIGVGEETGTLSKVLLEVALFYEGEVDQKTKDMSTVIEPFLMVFIGVGVGFFALAMISPIYSLSNNL